MYSTSSLGLALLRNKGTIVTYQFMKHFTTRFLQDKRPHSMILDNRVNTLVDTFHAETFVQDKIQDAHKDTNTQSQLYQCPKVPRSLTILSSLFIVANFPSVFLTQSILAVDALLRNLTVSTQLRCRFIFVFLVLCLQLYLSFSPQFLSCVLSNVWHSTAQRQRIFSCLQLAGILLFHTSSLHVRPTQWPPCPRHSRGCASPTCVFTLCGDTGLLFISTAFVDCHHVVLVHLSTCFKVLFIAFGLSSQTHPSALHVLSAITSDRNGNLTSVHVFLATLAGLVQEIAHVSCSSSESRYSPHRFSLPSLNCDLWGRKINFTNSKTLVGWWVSRPTVTRVTLDWPEWKHPQVKKREKQNENKKENILKKTTKNCKKQKTKEQWKMKKTKKIKKIKEEKKKTLNPEGRTPPFKHLACSVQSGTTPGPVFASKAEDTTNMFHHPSALQASTGRLCFCKSSHLSTRLCLHFASFPRGSLVVSPDGSRWIREFFNCSSKSILWRAVTVSIEKSFFSWEWWVLVHHKLAGFGPESVFLLPESDPSASVPDGPSTGTWPRSCLPT